MKTGTFVVAMLAISCQSGDPMVSANACVVW